MRVMASFKEEPPLGLNCSEIALILGNAFSNSEIVGNTSDTFFMCRRKVITRGITPVETKSAVISR
jgi:hypothetical protein